LPLRISFRLGDDDLRHFEQVAQQTQAIARARSADAIIGTAREVLEQAERAQSADFVKERFSRLRAMLAMASDPDWTLSPEDRQRVLNALAYFSAPAGEVPKTDAAVGFDHAIMVELVSRDLEHDLAAYRDFCKFRDGRSGRSERLRGGDREEQLRQRREALQARMHERRARALDRAGGSMRKLFALLGL
jgi:hypothetical protein